LTLRVSAFANLSYCFAKESRVIKEGWVRELRLLRFLRRLHGELKIERAFEVLEVSQDILHEDLKERVACLGLCEDEDPTLRNSWITDVRLLLELSKLYQD